jgi:ATP-binding cassette subfamily B protein
MSRRRHIQFSLILGLLFFTSIAEVFSIGAALPFLAILTEPERVFNNSTLAPWLQVMGFTEPSQLLLPLALFFGLAALVSAAMRLLLTWSITRMSFSVGADCSVEIYRRTLYQPYEVHCARNSSEVINGIAVKINAIVGMVFNALNIVASGFMLIFIIGALILINPIVALAVFFGFGGIYACIVFLNKNRLKINSERVARESTNSIQLLQEGLGGIRDILIDSSQEVYCNLYADADLPLRKAQADNQFISQAPRYIIEALGMLFISTLTYFIAGNANGINGIIPILGAMAMGAQRLLPVLQQAYGSWTGILGNKASLDDALRLLEQPLPSHLSYVDAPPISFKHSINLESVDFKYGNDGENILSSISISIAKGDRVGFIGVTGSGKSTLLDVVMGLLFPREGILRIDDEIITSNNVRSWQRHISHVPQNIYLADGTIEENIAFGVPKGEIDPIRVREAAELAQIDGAIQLWPKKYKTFVGERGVRLSGGQRQRIGIARALYKKADLIIFDEATSALDSATERAVMQSIENLGDEVTLLIIAHRISTLKNCTKIIELDVNGSCKVGNYKEMIENHEKSFNLN